MTLSAPFHCICPALVLGAVIWGARLGWAMQWMTWESSVSAFKAVQHKMFKGWRNDTLHCDWITGRMSLFEGEVWYVPCNKWVSRIESVSDVFLRQSSCQAWCFSCRVCSPVICSGGILSYEHLIYSSLMDTSSQSATLFLLSLSSQFYFLSLLNWIHKDSPLFSVQKDGISSICTASK